MRLDRSPRSCSSLVPCSVSLAACVFPFLFLLTKPDLVTPSTSDFTHTSPRALILIQRFEPRTLILIQRSIRLHTDFIQQHSNLPLNPNFATPSVRITSESPNTLYFDRKRPLSTTSIALLLTNARTLNAAFNQLQDNPSSPHQ